MHPSPTMHFPLLPARSVGKDAVLKTALLPAITMGVKNGAGLVGADAVKDMPLAVSDQAAASGDVAACSRSGNFAACSPFLAMRWGQ